MIDTRPPPAAAALACTGCHLKHKINSHHDQQSKSTSTTSRINITHPPHIFTGSRPSYEWTEYSRSRKWQWRTTNLRAVVARRGKALQSLPSQPLQFIEHIMPCRWFTHPLQSHTIVHGVCIDATKHTRVEFHWR